MEVTSELEKLFETDYERIKHIEVTYQNGGKVIGTAKSITLNPLALVIQKSEVKRREKPKHRVVFEHITHIEITLIDDSKICF